MEVFIGTILSFGFNFSPPDWQMCAGQQMPLNQYQALYALIGTYYGGNGTTYFNLPDLRGRTPIGIGNAPFTPPQTFNIGQATGAPTQALGLANLPPHNHAATFTPTTGPQNVTIPGTTGDLGVTVTVNATSNTAVASGPSVGLNSMLSSTGVSSQKVYGTTATTNLVPLSGVSAGVTGNPSIPQQTVSVQTVTGGTVQTALAGSGTPVSVYQPSLAVNFMIAVNGLFPSRQ
ncbi:MULTISPECIES: tail fiber protein [Methylobacterium]|jgi:microcystin-dependent protein|uniref:Microcystin-dependent protein n=2 Tax=Methylobacterium TaxID=407 RepID=A0A0C6FZH7_9HYPH|nr:MULTISPECIES: tail fiber protein [Methylobacterium]MBK3395984.1 tail fiber protein [Methylobacterium ajmalii]MBK3409717.1 tail fiber protein [Methylobacterium ajmalii]MBK3425142.1 tail fiber protein [Methylobacterium ajmalii]MBZ6413570.1 tail fiber protein [Methylobacterium sp.]SFF37212.1 Microcystin-dependent protein [Methylobacterium sp. yr596]